MAFYDESWFLWLQFVYLIWLIVRPAAFLRLPWCLLLRLLRCCCPVKLADRNQNASIYLVPGLKHMIQPRHYLAEKGDYQERLQKEQDGGISRVKGSSSAIAIRGFGKCIVVGEEDLENVTCIFCCQMDKQLFVREYLHVHAFMRIVRLCDLDTALRIYFSTKFFSVRVRGNLSKDLVEYSPLQPGQHWMYSIIATLPLLLQAKQYQLASAIVTVVAYFLDLFYNPLSDVFEELWLWTVRLMKVSSNWLPFTYKLFHYHGLCNFDQAFMPGCIDDLRIKRREITDFIFIQNALLPQKVEVVEEFEARIPDHITKATVNEVVQLWCYDLHFTFQSVEDEFLTFTAMVRGVAFDMLTDTYKIPVRNYFLFVAFLKWIKERNVPGLVWEIKAGRLMDTMICLGITETINEFLEPGIKIFKGKFNPGRTFLIGDTATDLF